MGKPDWHSRIRIATCSFNLFWSTVIFMSTQGSAGRAIDEVFGQNVREARVERGLTQEAVARQMQERKFDFHQATVYKVESGRRSVSVGEAFALAEILGDELSSIVRRRQDPLPQLTLQLDLKALRILEQLERLVRAVHDVDDELDELLTKAAAADVQYEPTAPLVERYGPLREAIGELDWASAYARLEKEDTKRIRATSDGYFRGDGALF